MFKQPHNCTHFKCWQYSESFKLGFSSRWIKNFQMYRLDLEKAGIRDQIANIHWITEKAREFQKNIYSASLTTLKPLTVWIITNWKILQEVGIPELLTCLLRNLYADQEATVRTRQGTTDWFKIGKGVHQGYILSSCLFNLYAGYIMWNAGLDDSQAGIKISGRNINNLRYADDTTLMAESE